MRMLFAGGLGMAFPGLAFLGLALAAGPVAAQGAARLSPDCAGASVPDRLHGLTPDGDLVLTSGHLARLSGIRLAPEQPYRDQALAWLRLRVGQPLLIRGGEGRDRWGRLSVRIRAEGAAPADFAHGLLEAGLAIVDPGAADGLCQPEWLAIERTARERSLGLWADARYNPLDAGQMNRFPDRIGTFVLVEGRIRTVGERGQRTYLNFGGHWAEDFTIIIPKGTWKLMTERGLGAEALKGLRIRARGILQSWQGTALTVVIPDMIERLEGERLPR